MVSRQEGLVRLAVLAALGCLAAALQAGDWPMWRADARHTAACAERLADELHLQWVRELPPTLLAWPNEPRLHFDAAYEPVVAGELLLVSSPNEGSLTAYHTRSGQPRWTFLAEGPVRFAPVVWNDKVFVGSDDGFLSCLNLSDGKLRSQVRGAPDDWPPRRHLGNARLVSFWPVRGGPVVADGTVYFGAGLWPTMGVFVVAVDAASERVVWRNDQLGHIENVRLDHNQLQASGLSPQGYLAVEGDLLLVPNGRSMPAGLDRRTGRLLWYVQGYRNGDCRVTVMGRYALVGAAGVVDMSTGREVGSRWAAAGAEAPQAFDGRKLHLFEGPIHPYKLFAGCSARSALGAGMAYDLQAGVFSARDLDAAATAEYEVDAQGVKLKPWRWEPPLLWTLPTEVAASKPGVSSLIRAGNRLYGHTGGRLLAVELPADSSSRPAIRWQTELSGTPASLLAADGRLFVVTQEGRLFCFGPERTESKRFTLEPTPLAACAEDVGRGAARLLQETGVQEGYCVCLGQKAAGLTEELLRQSQLKVIAVEPERERAHGLRRRLIDAGLYGTRAEVFIGTPEEFLLPRYVASLLVCEDPVSLAEPLARRWLETLRPYGGVLCLPAADASAGGGAGFSAPYQALATAAAAEKLDVQRTEQFVLLRRTGPLDGAAAWTHECADVGRSYCSHDRRVKPPLGILWYGDGPDYAFWKEKDYGTGVKPQVAGGRVFALHVARRTLVAYDVYTGRQLWKTAVSAFTRYASLPDGIYVAGDNRCRVLDPATGQEQASWPFEVEAGKPAFVADIRVAAADNVILIAAAPDKVRVIEKGLWDSTTLIALDRQSGTLLWKHTAQQRFNNHAVAIGAGLVFCADSASPIETDQAARQGEAPKELPSTLLALDARTGTVRWSQARMQRFRTYGIGGWVGMRGHDDWVAYCPELDIVLSGKHGQGRAWAARDGQELWSQPLGAQPLILRGTTFLTQDGHLYDTRTGKRLGGPLRLNHGGCNYAVGNEFCVFLRDRSATYVDVQTQVKHELFAIRSGCSNSLVAADGVLSVPNFAVGCVCNYPIQTSFAMVHMPELESRPPAPGGHESPGD